MNFLKRSKETEPAVNIRLGYKSLEEALGLGGG
jgi:hypothetical protein